MHKIRKSRVVHLHARTRVHAYVRVHINVRVHLCTGSHAKRLQHTRPMGRLSKYRYGQFEIGARKERVATWNCTKHSRI